LNQIAEKVEFPQVDSGTAAAAPRAPRLLAASVDYLVLFAVSALLLRRISDDTAILITSSAIFLCYYTLCATALTGGRTIGKMLFRLRVVRSANSNGYLSLPQAFLRYLAFLGLILLLAEAPPIFYRAYEIHADATLLELPIGIALVYFFLNIAVWLTNPAARGLHDFAAGSTVVRYYSSEAEADTSNLQTRLPTTIRRLVIGFAVGTGLLLWLLSTAFHTNEIQTLQSARFVVEARSNLRLVSIQPTAEARLELQLASEARSINPLELRDHVYQTLQELGVKPELMAKVTLRIFWFDGSEPQEELIALVPENPTL